jgi:hypothetical protein
MASIRAFAVILICGAALTSSAYAQTVDVNGPTAGSTAKTEKGVTTNGKNPTVGAATLPPDHGQMRADNKAPKGGVIVPKPTPNAAGNMAPMNGDESGVAPRADVANATGPEGPAIRSADDTAHKTVYDPNNQLGTSVEGKTYPIADAPDQPSQNQTN